MPKVSSTRTSTALNDEEPQPGTSNPYSMTEEVLQKRSEKVNAGRFRTQLLAGILASVSSISFGTVLGWSSPAIRASVDNDQLEDDTLDKTLEFSWVASLGPLGCAAGVPVWSYFNGHLGPKRTMIIQSPLLLIVWGVIGYIKHPQITLELVMRFFCGFFAISYGICGETLLTDTVHRYYLSPMVVTYRSCVSIGVLITYIMGYLVTDQFFAFTNCCIVLTHLIMLCFCPESPVYLYDKNTKKAEKSLMWYRGASNIYVEMQNIKKDSDIRKVDPAAYKYMLYSKVVMKAIAIVMMVNVAQGFSCYYMYLYYNPVVIKSTATRRAETLGEINICKSDDVISRNVDAVLLGLNMVICSFISTLVHYKVLIGVRKPIIISCCLVTLVLAALSVYMYLFEIRHSLVYKTNNWIYQILVHLLVICFEIGLSCCPEIMLVHYIPNQVFMRARMIVRMSRWVIIFLITKNFFHVSNQISGSGIFTIFSVLTLCISIAAGIFVVESKGKTLVQIQLEIGGNPVGSRGMYNKKLSKPIDLA